MLCSSICFELLYYNSDGFSDQLNNYSLKLMDNVRAFSKDFRPLKHFHCLPLSRIVNDRHSHHVDKELCHSSWYPINLPYTIRDTNISLSRRVSSRCFNCTKLLFSFYRRFEALVGTADSLDPDDSMALSTTQLTKK